MKKVLAVLAVLAFGVSVSVAQTSKVYGPKAKNNKVWINKTNSNKAHTAEKEKVTGPTAKNNQTWAKASDDAAKTSVTLEGERVALKGPAAKNYKYHKNNNVENTPELSDPQYVENEAAGEK